MNSPISKNNQNTKINNESKTNEKIPTTNMYYLNLLEINYKLLIRIQNKSKFQHKNIFQLDRFQFNN